MDIYKINWTRLQSEIFRFFCFKAGQSTSLRAVAKALNVTPTAVSHALAGMKDYIIIKKSPTMNLLSIELNRNNPKTLQLKRTENLRLIYESGLSDFLYNQFPGCTIILFGSYSRGEDINTESEETRSDIDIAIIGTKSQNLDLSKFNKILDRIISLNFYPSWDQIHKHLKNNILNGILLNGSVEL